MDGWEQALHEMPLLALPVVGEPGAGHMALEPSMGGCGTRPATIWQCDPAAVGPVQVHEQQRPQGPGHNVQPNANATTSEALARRWSRKICAPTFDRTCARDHQQGGVGHYGVFGGRRWQQQNCLAVRDTIHQAL